MGTQGHQRFPLFDPLRVLAAISILLVHTTIFSGAFDDPGYGRLLAHLDIGVSFFFLLSAFLLYRPFVQSRIVPFGRFGACVSLRHDSLMSAAPRVMARPVSYRLWK